MGKVFTLKQKYNSLKKLYCLVFCIKIFLSYYLLTNIKRFYKVSLKYFSCSMFHLPPELLVKITAFLPCKDLYILVKSSNSVRQILLDAGVWARRVSSFRKLCGCQICCCYKQWRPLNLHPTRLPIIKPEHKVRFMNLFNSRTLFHRIKR